MFANQSHLVNVCKPKVIFWLLSANQRLLINIEYCLVVLLFDKCIMLNSAALANIWSVWYSMNANMRLSRGATKPFEGQRPHWSTVAEPLLEVWGRSLTEDGLLHKYTDYYQCAFHFSEIQRNTLSIYLSLFLLILSIYLIISVSQYLPSRSITKLTLISSETIYKSRIFEFELKINLCTYACILWWRNLRNDVIYANNNRTSSNLHSLRHDVPMYFFCSSVLI